MHHTWSFVFMLHINDFSSISHLIHTVLFADNTTNLIESDTASAAIFPWIDNSKSLVLGSREINLV